jgi:hypothetical protein
MGRTDPMPHAKPQPIGATAPNRHLAGPVKRAGSAYRAAERDPGSADRGGGEAVAEHDWLATLDLVRQASRQIRQTDETAKNLARNAQAFIHYANQMFEEGASEMTAKPSAASLAGLAGIALSWLALLWFVLAEDPFFGLKAAAPALTRHHLITLAQCALFTSLTLTVIGILQRGFGASLSFYEAVLKRAARHDPGAAGGEGKHAIREGHLDGRPYVLFSNGAVELETVFGVRSFGSLDEAREFIGEAKPGLTLAH